MTMTSAISLTRSKSIGKSPPRPEIGVVEDDQAAEVARAGAADVRQVAGEVPVPRHRPGPSWGRTAPRACPRA